MEVLVSNPSHWLDRAAAEAYSEPVVRGTIISPMEYMNDIGQWCTLHFYNINKTVMTL